MTVPVEFSGPLFDGTAERLLQQGADEAEHSVAVELQTTIRSTLARSARKRTGFYESRVRLESSRGDTTVTDRGVVYADWLQGTSRRNASTGFKGYRHVTRAVAVVDPKAAQIAERALGPFIDRMG